MQKHRSAVHSIGNYIPANCPVFGGTVQFFEVSDSKKLDCPVFFFFFLKF